MDMFSPELDPHPFLNLVTQFQLLNGDKLGRIVNYRLKNFLKKQRLNQRLKQKGYPIDDDEEQCTFTPKINNGRSATPNS